MAARDGYSRILLWLSNQGFVADIAGHEVLAGQTPQARDQLFEAKDGTSRALNRAHEFDFRAVKRNMRDFLREMERFGCKGKMVAFGSGGQHQVWQEASRFHVLDARSGFGGFAGARCEVRNTIFEPAIWQDENLLAGVPWHHASAVDDGGGTYYLEHPTMPGYDGPKWEGSSGDAVADDGSATIASSLTLEMELPAQGATLKLVDCTGTLTALDWNGAQLASAVNDVELVLPEYTWSVEIIITAADAQPSLQVVKSGAATGPRFGDFDTNCATRVALPPWVPEAALALMFMDYDFRVDGSTSEHCLVSLDPSDDSLTIVMNLEGLDQSVQDARFWYDAVQGALYYLGTDNVVYKTTDGVTSTVAIASQGFEWQGMNGFEGSLWLTGPTGLWEADLSSALPITPVQRTSGHTIGGASTPRYDSVDRWIGYEVSGDDSVWVYDIEDDTEFQLVQRTGMNGGFYLVDHLAILFYGENNFGSGFESLEWQFYGGSSATEVGDIDSPCHGLAITYEAAETGVAYMVIGNGGFLKKMDFATEVITQITRQGSSVTLGSSASIHWTRHPSQPTTDPISGSEFWVWTIEGGVVCYYSSADAFTRRSTFLKGDVMSSPSYLAVDSVNERIVISDGASNGDIELCSPSAVLASDTNGWPNGQDVDPVAQRVLIGDAVDDSIEFRSYANFTNVLPEYQDPGSSSAGGAHRPIVDTENDLVFWGNNGDDAIRKAPLDGSGPITTILSGDKPSETQMAFDPVTQRVFYRPANTDELKSVDYDGSNSTVRYTAPAGWNVNGIARDPENNVVILLIQNASDSTQRKLIRMDPSTFAAEEIVSDWGERGMAAVSGPIASLA